MCVSVVYVVLCAGLTKSEECQSMPALAGGGGAGAAGGVLGIIPEHSLLDSCTRLSISLEESVFKVTFTFVDTDLF